VERVVEALAADLTADQLYRLLRLRAEVFVVEQACVYLDPDGRDLEPATRHLWLEDGASGVVVAALRVLAEPGGGSSVGRVVTAPSHRSQGLGARLVAEALEGAPRPVHINAQSHLVEWYGRFGFVVDGAEFVEDGIPHTPMVLAS
jgi:ElaA protein